MPTRFKNYGKFDKMHDAAAERVLNSPASIRRRGETTFEPVKPDTSPGDCVIVHTDDPAAPHLIARVRENLVDKNQNWCILVHARPLWFKRFMEAACTVIPDDAGDTPAHLFRCGVCDETIDDRTLGEGAAS